MLQDVFRHDWEAVLELTSEQAFDQAAGVVMVFMTTEWGLRVSNVAQTVSISAQRKTFHDRMHDSEFRAIMAAGGELLNSHVLRAMAFSVKGSWVAAFDFCRAGVPAEGVDAVGVVICSSKSNQFGQREVSYVVGRGSWAQGVFVDVLVKWAALAQFDSARDPFMSRPSLGRLQGGCLARPTALSAQGWPAEGLRKIFQSSAAVKGAKEAARRAGQPPERYSSKSFKIAGISTVSGSMEALGLADAEVAGQFDHKTVSANKAYRRCDVGRRAVPEGGVETFAPSRGERVSPLGSLGSNGEGLFSHQGVLALTGLHEYLAREQEADRKGRRSFRAEGGGGRECDRTATDPTDGKSDV